FRESWCAADSEFRLHSLRELAPQLPSECCSYSSQSGLGPPDALPAAPYLSAAHAEWRGFPFARSCHRPAMEHILQIEEREELTECRGLRPRCSRRSTGLCLVRRREY